MTQFRKPLSKYPLEALEQGHKNADLYDIDDELIRIMVDIE